VDEVIAWADSEASDREVVIYVSTKRANDEPGLIRLLGIDPTSRTLT
jgi:hypothetical protein